MTGTTNDSRASAISLKASGNTLFNILCLRNWMQNKFSSKIKQPDFTISIGRVPLASRRPNSHPNIISSRIQSPTREICASLLSHVHFPWQTTIIIYYFLKYPPPPISNLTPRSRWGRRNWDTTNNKIRQIVLVCAFMWIWHLPHNGMVNSRESQLKIISQGLIT